MSGMEPLFIASMVAGTAATAAGQVMQGQEQARAAEFEQEQLKIREQTEKIAATQEEARRRNELTSNLETIQALRAGRGVGSASPTGMAIFDSITADAERDISVSKFNASQRADSARRAAEMAGGKAKTSLLGGYLGAAGTIGEAGFRYANIKSYGRTARGTA